MSSPRIVFAGTPETAASCLDRLIKADFKIVAVLTQPDSRKGRASQVSASPVKELALKNNLPVYQPASKDELTKVFQELKPDLVITVAYGTIMSQEALDVPKYGVLNLHYSLLPQYRGAAPYVAAILNGDKETGVSILRTSLSLDEGDVVATKKVPLKGTETSESLLHALTQVGAELLVETIPQWLSGEIKAKKQAGATSYARRIQKQDGQIDWNKDATEIERMVRAYNPWPSTFTRLNGKIVKILKATLVEKSLSPGEISVENGELVVGTGNMSLRIQNLQPEGKKAMTGLDYINGNSNLNGKYFGK